MKKTIISWFILHFGLAQAISPGFEKFLFSPKDEGVRTEAFVLKGEGQQFEKFVVGTWQTKHLLWSMTKTICSLIFGAMETQGIISREDFVYKYLKLEIDKIGGKKAEALKKIRLEHLLTMSSGLSWNEFYEEDPFNSDIVRMLYIELAKGATGFVLNREAKYEAGKHFYYSSGDTFLLMAALKNAVPKKQQSTFPWDFLFNAMSLDAIFEKDKDGVFVGPSYIYLKAEDLEKLAKLILQNGVWNDKRLISENYMQFFKKPAKVNDFSCESQHYTYGASVWLNQTCPANGRKRFPRSSDDIILFLGHAGQSVVIFPSKNAYAIRLARDDQHKFDLDQYILFLERELNED